MEEVLTLNREIIDISVEDIIPNRFQPRLTFDTEALNELANSIREHGIIQPLVVRRVQDKFEIIAGERRYKAASLIGMKKVPCIIMDLNDNESAEVAVIENIQRKEMSPLEEAKSFKKLLDKGYLTQDELAKRMGKSQSSIANKLRLLNLDEVVQEAILNNKISERHARSLLKLDSKEEQRNILNEIIEKKLTVKQTDELIKERSNIGGTKMNNDVNNNINMNNIINDNNINSIFKEPTINESQNISQYPQNQKLSLPEVNIPTNNFSMNPQANLINNIGNIQESNSNYNANQNMNQFNKNDINNVINPSVLSSQQQENNFNYNSNNMFSRNDINQNNDINVFQPNNDRLNVNINDIKNNAVDIKPKEQEKNDISNLMSSEKTQNKFFVDLNMQDSFQNQLPFRVQNAVDSINRKIDEIKTQGTNIIKEEKDLGNIYEIVIRIDK